MTYEYAQHEWCSREQPNLDTFLSKLAEEGWEILSFSPLYGMETQWSDSSGAIYDVRLVAQGYTYLMRRVKKGSW